MAWTPPPPALSEWPLIRGGVSRRVPDVSGTPALTASARWRYALRDDTYIDHRLNLLIGSTVRARLHVPRPSPSSRVITLPRAASVTSTDTGDLCLHSAPQRLVVLPTSDVEACDSGEDISVLREPARGLAARIPSATSVELDALSGFGCHCDGQCVCRTGRVCQRVVFSDIRDRALLYATFFWDARVHSSLSGILNGVSSSLVLPSALGRERYEHSRKMLSVVYGPPGDARPTWGREYVFKRRRKPFLVVQEVFAEGICRYLGPITPPLF